MVTTPTGKRPIGEIEPGEKVLAFNFAEGKWVARTVEARHDSEYEGPLVSVTTSTETIETTVYHPFWVVSGRDLSDRPVPREFAPDEDQGLGQAGRWVNSHDVRVGDLILGSDGVEREVIGLSQRSVSGFGVSNLTVQEFHSFSVGSAGILVHNTGFCDLFPNGMFGRTAKQILEKTPKGWSKVPARGNGWKLVDENGIERIRFMRPNKNGGFFHEKVGYWRLQDEAGNFLDEFGNIVSKLDPDFHIKTHIPYSGT